MLQKFLSLILALLLAFALPGCTTGEETSAPSEESESHEEAISFSEDPDAVTILTYSNFGGGGDPATFFGQFLSYAAYAQSDIKVEIIDINIEDQAVLDTTVQQLKTEIMAGRGPDIYLLPTTDYTFTNSKGETIFQESFFGDVEEGMNNKLFLPLDDYIAASQHIRMENYPEAVMAAGRSEDGQVVMPLAYTYDLVLMDKNKMLDPNLSYSSLEELLNCGDNKLIGSLLSLRSNWFRSLWGSIADYESTNLTISEDEIWENLEKTKIDASLYSPSKDRITLDYYFEDYFGAYLPSFTLCTSTLETWYNDKENIYVAHIPNGQNGITAYIPIFAAINSNTSHPEEAFKILELLYSDAVQLGKAYGNYNSTIQASYIQNFFIGDDPVQIDVNAQPRPEMTEFIEDMNQRINIARFESNLELLLTDICENATPAKAESNPDMEEWLKSYIHKIYTEMQMEMAE